MNHIVWAQKQRGITNAIAGKDRETEQHTEGDWLNSPEMCHSPRAYMASRILHEAKKNKRRTSCKGEFAIEGRHIHCMLPNQFYNSQVVGIVARLCRGSEVNCGAIIILIVSSSCHPEKGPSNCILPCSELYNPCKHLDKR